MIETAKALDNLDAILSVEGLDAVYIGPSDLSLSLGCKPTICEFDPKAAQAIDHVLERARAHGLVARIHNGMPEAAHERIAKGFRFVTISSDARRPATRDGHRLVLAAHHPLQGFTVNIGFIGLGIMGTPMALHLVNAGHQLHVHTASRIPEAIAASSAKASANAADVTRRSEIVFTMAPDTPDVEAVLFGAGGVAEGLNAGGTRKIVVDMSSISPTGSRRRAMTNWAPSCQPRGHWLRRPTTTTPDWVPATGERRAQALVPSGSCR